MKQKRQLTEKEIEERIKMIDGTMSQEGMPLTEKDKQRLRDCMSGKTTYQKERQKIINECRRIYG